MKQSLQLRVSQQLTMTPQLQQAIKMLQLSNLELQVEIQQALESNPMLDELESDNNELDNNYVDDAPVANKNESSEIDYNSSEKDEDAESIEPELDLKSGDIPEELQTDTNWEDVYDTFNINGTNAELDRDEYQEQAKKTESLREQLLWQVELEQFSEIDKLIALALVDAINEDGYLTCSLEEIQTTLKELLITINQIEEVLCKIQNFEPLGVGARNLKECLLLQLRALPMNNACQDTAYNLINDYLPLLAQHDFTQLTRRLKIDEEELREVIRLIKSLNPKPGAQLISVDMQYIIPDVLVTRSKGIWKAELNHDNAPRLRVNPYYASLVRRADNSPNNSYLRGQLQEARWFIKSLQSRNETLLKVANAIVERQIAFLEKGEEAMRPLVIHDISEAIGMHESTISRVTMQKYMNTPRGIYELKYFFSSHLNTSGGGECSSTAIRALIKRLVNAEQPEKPLSDDKIAKLLLERGIQVARRTVAKYREAMSIPPSNERKRLT